MKKILLMALAATGMLATSCRDFDQFDDHAIKIQDYNRDFTKVFGNVDPNHTWNTASQRSMDFTINVPGTFNLRVFTTNPKNESTQSELLANFTNNGQGYKSGDTYSITFDCPSGLRKVWADIQYVGSERHIIQQVEMDMEGYAKAVFGGDGAQTRATIVPSSTQLVSGKDLIVKTGKKEIFTKQAYTGEGDTNAGGKGFIDIIPENVQNTSREEVHTDFVYVSTGETYHLYPIYIYTGANVQIGIQYRQNEESDWSEEIPMMTTSANSTDRITRLFSSEGSGRSVINETAPYPYQPSGFDWHSATYYDGGQQSVSGGAKYATVYTDNDFVGTLCDEIELNFPKGYEFRFWVKQELAGRQTFIRYSDRESNSDKTVYFGTFNNKHKHNGQNVLYLGVEDWNSGTQDINDIVFAFVGSIPTIVDEGGPHYLDAEYVIAYEDMGLNDFDFNDIVLSVQHVAGESTASVKILACGGTLPVYLGFDDSGDTNEKVCSSSSNALSLFEGKELHHALSGKENSYSEPMNVDGENLRVVNRSNLKYEPKLHTMMGVPTTFSIVDKAQYFKLKVVQNTVNGIGVEKATTEITTPVIGSKSTTPQAFVVSYTNWEWPTERTQINKVYEDFDKWLEKHNSQGGGMWYKPIWSGLDDVSSNIDYSTTLRPSYSFDICLRTRDDIGDNTTITIPKDDFAIHGLTESTSLVMAFVVTNRNTGKQPSVTVYKNSAAESNKLGNTLTFSDVSTTSTTSSYGDADKINVEIGNWSDVSDIVVVFNNDGDANCKLNSIWAAKADDKIKMLDYEDIVGRIDVENLHDESCNFGQDCNYLEHTPENVVAGKLATVGASIEVAIANSSTTKPNFLVCGGSSIQHQHSIASMVSNAQAIATSSSSDNAWNARFILTVTEIITESDGSISPVVSIKHKTKDQYLKQDGTRAVWSNTCETKFKICRGTGGSRTSCIPGWNDDDMFRFQAVGTNYYFNVDGPQFKTGNGEWSLWYMFEILNN